MKIRSWLVESAWSMYIKFAFAFTWNIMKLKVYENMKRHKNFFFSFVSEQNFNHDLNLQVNAHS